LPSLDLGALDTLKVTRNILNVSLSLLVVPHLAPQSTGLLKVEFSDLGQVSPSTANKGLVASTALLIANSSVDGSLSAKISQGVNAALVVGAAALGNEGRGTIPLEIVDGVYGRVDGELLVVDTETVAVGVRVGKESGLEDGIRRGLDVRDEMRRRESSLLNLGEVVLRVLVEDELSERAEWELGVWPDLGEIKNVVAEFLSLIWCHSLHINCP
jgi:hypothetical protein